MKTKLLVLVLVLFSASVFSQRNRPPGPKPCENFPGHIDSIVRYIWDQPNNSWKHSATRFYKYSGDRLLAFLNITPISRDTILSWEFYYDQLGNRNLALYYTWDNYVKVLKQKIESVYNEKNQKINELTSNLINNIWHWRAYQYNIWEDDKLIKSVYQLKDRGGAIYDFTHTYYFYENDNLMEVVVKRGTDGFINRISKYKRNSLNQVTEISNLTPILNSITNEFDYIESSRTFYSYNKFNLLEEVLSETLVNNIWINSNRDPIFYRIDNAHRVRVCLRGRNLCVAKRAVPGLLNAGGTLGLCPGTSTTAFTTRTQSTTTGNANLKPFESVKVYPNPASEFITVIAGDGFTRVELINSNGQSIRSFSLVDSNQTVIERNGLPSGIYFLRFVGQEEVKTEKVIFR